MNPFDESYKRFVLELLANGTQRDSRAGPTIQTFGSCLKVSVEHTFPILTTRKIHYMGVFGELAAFLQGATTVKQFEDQGCNYWSHNAAEWEPNHYELPENHVVGRIYGAQWRNWQGSEAVQGYDQLHQLIKGLKANPYGRRHLLTTYNPAELRMMCLPPCHLLAQFNVREDGLLDCIVYMRSVDVCLGLPSDIVLYAALLVLVANEVDLYPGDLVFMMGDTHMYLNHGEGLLKQLGREALQLPTYRLKETTSIFSFKPTDLELIDYISHPSVSYKLN